MEMERKLKTYSQPKKRKDHFSWKNYFDSKLNQPFSIRKEQDKSESNSVLNSEKNVYLLYPSFLQGHPQTYSKEYYNIEKYLYNSSI